MFSLQYNSAICLLMLSSKRGIRSVPVGNQCWADIAPGYGVCMLDFTAPAAALGFPCHAESGDKC